MVVQLRAVANVVDKETVETCRQLLREAERGQVIGMAYVVMERGNQFSADVVGGVRLQPVLAYGVMGALETVIRRLFE